MSCLNWLKKLRFSRKTKKLKNPKKNTNEINIVADFIVEEYRFLKSYISAVNKLFPEERNKYLSAYEFHVGKINDMARATNLSMPNYENMDYEEGLPLSILNADEFTKEDVLVIKQIIEPAIINTITGKTIRFGSVILAKKPQEINETKGEK
ncbi:MAG: hypothetical protein WC240_08530 [Bacilli bacterium]